MEKFNLLCVIFISVVFGFSCARMCVEDCYTLRFFKLIDDNTNLEAFLNNAPEIIKSTPY